MTVKTRARLRNINRRCLLGASQLSVDNLLDFECFIYSWPPNPIYPPARRKLAEHGITCGGHAARQLTKSDYKEFDLLIGMDSANLRNMHRICGGDPDGKIHLLLDYTDHPSDVADPWYTDDFEATWRDVLAGCQGLLKELSQKRGEQDGTK